MEANFSYFLFELNAGITLKARASYETDKRSDRPDLGICEIRR